MARGNLNQWVNEVAKRCDKGIGTFKALRIVKKKFCLNDAQIKQVEKEYSQLRCQRIAG